MPDQADEKIQYLITSLKKNLLRRLILLTERKENLNKLHKVTAFRYRILQRLMDEYDTEYPLVAVIEAYGPIQKALLKLPLRYNSCRRRVRRMSWSYKKWVKIANRADEVVISCLDMCPDVESTDGDSLPYETFYPRQQLEEWAGCFD